MSFLKPTPNEINNWKKIVAKGKWRYVRTNFMSFGINMILFTLAIQYINQKPIAIKLLLTKENLLEAFLFGILGGLIFSFGSWYVAKWRYRRYL
ncbi:MAG: hypothetical protein ACLGGV_02405 [Bacteroidia bacterium]